MINYEKTFEPVSIKPASSSQWMGWPKSPSSVNAAAEGGLGSTCWRMKLSENLKFYSVIRVREVMMIGLWLCFRTELHVPFWCCNPGLLGAHLSLICPPIGFAALLEMSWNRREGANQGEPNKCPCARLCGFFTLHKTNRFLHPFQHDSHTRFSTFVSTGQCPRDFLSFAYSKAGRKGHFCRDTGRVSQGQLFQKFYVIFSYHQHEKFCNTKKSCEELIS